MYAQATPERVVRIDVTRTSGTVPARFAATLPAVRLGNHARAVNLLLGDYLLTVGDASLGGLPNGVQAAGFEALREELGRGTRHDVRLDFSHASVWSPRLHAMGVPADISARHEAAERAARGLPNAGLLPLLHPAAEDPVSGAAGAVIRTAREPFEGLRSGLLGRDVDAVASAGSALIGLGFGLTPSGDDLLVGFAATLAAAGHPMAPELAVRWARDAERGTGLVALSFHRHAAAGEYSERIHDLLSAILVEPIEGIEPAVREAARWGATSGGDTVVGVVTALAGIRA